MLQKMRDLIGWNQGNGIFAPGGSISNLYGLVAARYQRFPDIKEKGIIHLPQMVIFSSEEVCVWVCGCVCVGGGLGMGVWESVCVHGSVCVVCVFVFVCVVCVLYVLCAFERKFV